MRHYSSKFQVQLQRHEDEVVPYEDGVGPREGPLRPRKGPLRYRKGPLWHEEGSLRHREASLRLREGPQDPESALSDLQGPSWIYRWSLLELFEHLKKPTQVGFSKGSTSPLGVMAARLRPCHLAPASVRVGEGENMFKSLHPTLPTWMRGETDSDPSEKKGLD